MGVLCIFAPKDEVHERDRYSDFLLIILREVLLRMKTLKVILMSAALNVQHFCAYFNGCQVISGNNHLCLICNFILRTFKLSQISVEKNQACLSRHIHSLMIFFFSFDD